MIREISFRLQLHSHVLKNVKVFQSFSLYQISQTNKKKTKELNEFCRETASLGRKIFPRRDGEHGKQSFLIK